ncbi:radical SAM protein [Geoglobus acetivorans]|uniref:Radical SAM protein n=1 Tax=Geoglobus acetivorans TaxID=565033 RepID=A0ABZ3H3W6_GEOAI|nr:radical SAM protein [Geoglobus acetivorans]
MELSKLRRLIQLSHFDVCHERCVFDPFRAIYRSAGANLFKTLISSSCSYDCHYCNNAWNKGYAAKPEEIVKAFELLLGNGLVNGAFLSNSIRDPERSMDEIIESAEMIRRNFDGYLHLKIIPGCTRDQIKQAVMLADRVSVNLESPSYSILTELCSTKSRSDFSRTLRIALKMARRAGRSFTTQMIAGLGEKDVQILKVAEKLYERGVRRVYYSRFTPLKGTPLENMKRERKARVVKLYRADALIRLYGFDVKELEEIMVDGNLMNEDPKILFALKKLERGEELRPLEVPGLGLKTSGLVEKGCSLLELKKLGFSIRRATAFDPSQRRLHDFGIKTG